MQGQYPEVIDAVGGGHIKGNFLSSSAGKYDLQPLHHAATCSHGVVLIISSQENGAAPISARSNGYFITGHHCTASMFMQ